MVKKILEMILHHSEKQIIYEERQRFGKIIDIIIPGKGGVLYTEDGKFICFLEP